LQAESTDLCPRCQLQHWSLGKRLHLIRILLSTVVQQYHHYLHSDDDMRHELNAHHGLVFGQ
jgi:hypothetical protein